MRISSLGPYRMEVRSMFRVENVYGGRWGGAILGFDI